MKRNTDKAVIFIHGFMGSPRQFKDLAEAVNESGYFCVSLLLPGHGESGYRFINCKMTDWEIHVQKEIERLCDKFDKIYLIGHSMGGLLALNASLNKKNKIAGVFMISTPLKINIFNIKSLISRIRLLAYPKNHEIKAEYIQSNDMSIKNISDHLMILKPVLELNKLIKKTKVNLKNVSVPVIMIHSKRDETTSLKSVGVLYDGLSNTSKKSIIIEKSWHAYFTSDERDLICKEMIKFIMEKTDEL